MKYFFFLFTFCFGISAFTQVLTHPVSGFSNITLQKGVTYQYYDDGGADANYGAGTSSVLTIYPAKPGEYVSITCNSFDINSDCRMYVFDGNHPGSDILGYYYLRSTQRKYQLLPGDVITASEGNASGAISIRFTNTKNRATLAGWDFTVTSTKIPGPTPAKTTQDCSGAIKVCSDSAITTKAQGSGYQELPGPNYWNVILNYGRDGENQSNWYKFEVKTPGTIEFLIKPHSFTDFDWGLWGPYDMHECPAFTADKAYRISSCDGKYSQITGLSSKATDHYEDSYGDGYVSSIQVKKGEHYVLMIDDWSGNHSTFDLTWKFLNGASLECAQDEEPPSDPPPPVKTKDVVEVDPCTDKMVVSSDLKNVTAETTGEIAVEIQGGKAPYQFQWRDGAGKKLSTQQHLLGVTQGKYDLEITDANGCVHEENFAVEMTVEYVEIAEEEPQIKAEISTDQAFVTVSYPGAFEYKIENLDSETVITGHSVDSDLVEITKLPPGTYRVSLVYKKIRQYTSFVKE